MALRMKLRSSSRDDDGGASKRSVAWFPESRPRLLIQLNIVSAEGSEKRVRREGGEQEGA